MSRRRQQQSEKEGCGFGRPRGWRPREDELPIDESKAPPEEYYDDEEDAQDEADQRGSSYGIRIIWGEGKRRPGERLEQIAARR